MNTKKIPVDNLIDEELENNIECNIWHCILCVLLSYVMIISSILLLKYIFQI